VYTYSIFLTLSVLEYPYSMFLTPKM
jgi:hypothetical protein